MERKPKKKYKKVIKGNVKEKENEKLKMLRKRSGTDKWGKGQESQNTIAFKIIFQFCDDLRFYKKMGAQSGTRFQKRPIQIKINFRTRFGKGVERDGKGKMARGTPSAGGGGVHPSLYPTILENSKTGFILEHKTGPGAVQKLSGRPPDASWATIWPGVPGTTFFFSLLGTFFGVLGALK